MDFIYISYTLIFYNQVMKKYLILCVFTILLGCKQDNMIDTEKYHIWCANPIATIDDGMVHLNWAVMFDDVLRPYEFVNPDQFDIYISQNDMSNFHRLIELNNDESYSYTVNNLQNGSSYLFYMVSKKKGFEPLYSDTIMVIPNKKKAVETILTSDDHHTLWNVSIAQQKNKIAYVDGYYSWNEGNNMAVSVLISNLDGSEKELVRINSYGPRWSPANDKLVFFFDGILNVGWIPSQVALYDCNTKSITQLTDDTKYNYDPVFSKDGNLLLFQSGREMTTYFNGTESDIANIWCINMKTLESFQVTDISKTSIIIARYPCWIDSDRFLFDGFDSENNNYQLFESSVSNQQIKKVFNSKWNDIQPSISPDQQKIAFISDRSNTNQIWIYFINTNTYSQITGYTNNESIESTNIEWLDNSTIAFTINGNQLVKQRID